MAHPPKFRKPFRAPGDDYRGGENFRSRPAPRDDFQGDRPRQEFRREGDAPGGQYRNDAPRREYQGQGGGFDAPRRFDRPRDEGGIPPRRPFRGEGDTRGQGYRPRFQGAQDRGGFRPRPDWRDDRPRQDAPRGDLLSDVGQDGPPRGGFRGPRDDRGFGRRGFQDDRQGPPMNALRNDEMKISGRNACRALFDQAPRRMIRVYISQELLLPWDDIIKFCRENKLAYHIADAEELARVAESDHHEGVCMVVVQKPAITFREFIENTPSHDPCLVVALDGVGNPHNIGAITRVAAHFGAAAVISSDIKATQSGAAARTAEGALEYVHLIGCDDLKSALNTFKVAGFQIIATSSHEGDDLFRQPLPARCVLLLGSEGAGVTERLLASADRKVRIPGSGKVESLNVACAASVLLGEAWRTRQPPTSP
jgi:TrmH RNA methyltransferase